MTEGDRPDSGNDVDDEVIKDLNYAADELGISFEDAMGRAAALQALILTLENEDVRVLLLSPDGEECLPIEQHPLYTEMVARFDLLEAPVQIFPSTIIEVVGNIERVDCAGNLIKFPNQD